jgi:hypothetical protein
MSLPEPVVFAKEIAAATRPANMPTDPISNSFLHPTLSTKKIATNVSTTLMTAVMTAKMTDVVNASLVLNPTDCQRLVE